MLEFRRNKLVQATLCLADLDSVFQGICELFLSFFCVFSPLLLQFFKLGLNVGKGSSLLNGPDLLWFVLVSGHVCYHKRTPRKLLMGAELHGFMKPAAQTLSNHLTLTAGHLWTLVC